LTGIASIPRWLARQHNDRGHREICSLDPLWAALFHHLHVSKEDRYFARPDNRVFAIARTPQQAFT
jgi:hypothetical protein